MSDCRFGVSPVNYPDPDPDPEKSLYFIRKHIRNCFLLPDLTFNDLTTCFISETWWVLVVMHIVLTNLDHLAS